MLLFIFMFKNELCHNQILYHQTIYMDFVTLISNVFQSKNFLARFWITLCAMNWKYYYYYYYCYYYYFFQLKFWHCLTLVCCLVNWFSGIRIQLADIVKFLALSFFSVRLWQFSILKNCGVNNFWPVLRWNKATETFLGTCVNCYQSLHTFPKFCFGTFLQWQFLIQWVGQASTLSTCT